MIKTNRGETIAIGSNQELLADLSVIVGTLNESLVKEVGAEEAKECIMDSVEVGFMSDDEFEVRKKQTQNKIACELTEALDELKKIIMEGMMKDGSK